MSGSDCAGELCPLWGGDQCLCALYGIDPELPPENGVFPVPGPDEDAS